MERKRKYFIRDNTVIFNIIEKKNSIIQIFSAANIKYARIRVDIVETKLSSERFKDFKENRLTRLKSKKKKIGIK